MVKKVENETSWSEIGNIFFKIVYTIVYDAFFLWLGVNLFLTAFKIPAGLTILQAIATCFLCFIINGVFGIGEKR